MTERAQGRGWAWIWIHSPAVDLPLFTFSWVYPFVAFVLASKLLGEPVCEVGAYPKCGAGAMLVFLVGDWTIQIHRHYTLALSYGDGEHVVRHRRLFVLFPAALAAVLAVLGSWRFYPVQLGYPAYLAFIALAAPAFAWNFPHVILQKYGLIRVYSTRLGYGDAHVEKQLVLSWMFAMAAWLVFAHGQSSIDGLARTFGINIRWMQLLVAGARYLIYPFAAWAAWATFRWLRDEVRNFKPRNIPKLLYVASVACILATGFYSAVVGFIVFGVSHSIEYVAFLSSYGKHRASLQGWIRNPWLVNVVCLPSTLVLLLSIYFGAPYYFFAYTLFNTYIHLLYDAYIWKIREPTVRSAVMAIGR